MNSIPTRASATNDPQPPTPSSTGLVVLAAGQASRMGTPKQLLEWDGKPLIRHAVEQALQSKCTPVVVVLGFGASQMREALAGLPIQIVENPAWETGMASSIQTGVQALAAQNINSLILTLADQPKLTPAIYDHLAQLHRETGQSVVTSEYSGTVGVPVLFGRERYADLLALKGAQGCKGVIQAHRDQALGVPCPEAEFDIDTPADYERLRGGPDIAAAPLK